MPLLPGSTRSVIVLIVSVDTRLPRFSFIWSLISRVVSQCVKPDDAVSDTFGKNSLAFLNKQGIERDIAVTGVDTVTSPMDVLTYFCIFPLQRLPLFACYL